MMTTANPTPSSAAAHAHAHAHALASRPLELPEARRQRDALKSLLRTEQAAMADFLVALAAFDARRGWEVLGHANLFAFIHSELGLSPAPTYWRQEAARLLQRFPDLVEPLRQGRLCLTTMAELAKVLTEVNREVVLPRFLGISSREAKEIVAELQPREAPATRAVVTRLPDSSRVSSEGAAPVTASFTWHSLAPSSPAGLPPSQLWAPKVDFGGAASPVARRDEVESLSGERSRLHVNVSRQITRKLEAARKGLGHAIPNATIEQTLEAALDLLLEKQARARGMVKRPRNVATTATPTPTPTSTSTPTAMEPPPHRRDGHRAAIPAAVRRAVWQRDGGRCSWALDGGGVCGSTHRLELDHIVPWADWGGEQEANLRVVCAVHNRLAARQAFGERVVGRYTGKRTRRAG
jgi:hypothetical protein